MQTKKVRSPEIDRRLRERIKAMEAGASFPIEVELTEEFGVCCATINKVLKNIERDGLLVSQQ